jgi:hypothetical protein
MSFSKNFVHLRRSSQPDTHQRNEYRQGWIAATHLLTRHHCRSILPHSHPSPTRHYLLSASLSPQLPPRQLPPLVKLQRLAFLTFRQMQHRHRQPAHQLQARLGLTGMPRGSSWSSLSVLVHVVFWPSLFHYVAIAAASVAAGQEMPDGTTDTSRRTPRIHNPDGTPG